VGHRGHPIFLLSSIIYSVIILNPYKMCDFHGHTSPVSSLLRVGQWDVGGVIGDVGDILTFPYIHAILVRAQKSSH
jgi:hypothetical protein